MTEPGVDSPREPDGEHPDDEVSAPFKADRAGADNHDVDDSNVVPPRMTWSPVTETGGASRAADPEPQESGFHFDLGGALARFSGDAPVDPPTPTEPLLPRSPQPQEPESDEPTADPLAPVRGLMEEAPVDQVLPRRDAGGAARDDGGLPQIREATSPSEPVRPRARSSRSVFEDGQTTAAPSLPASSPDEPRLPGAAAGAPALPPRSPASTPAPVQPAAPATPLDMMPTLPPSVTAAPPPVAGPIESAPSTPDIHALRSAQLRASRDERKGRLFGRTLLAFLLIGGLIALALVFGRAYLFPTEWDPSLTPIVDAIQEERGAEFEQTVPLVVQARDEYAATVLQLTIGSDWAERVPEWRAAGLASGDPTVASVAAALAAGQPVIYDPTSETIYQSADADPAAVEAGLRLELESVFDRQTRDAEDDGVVATGAVGFTGVSRHQDIVRRAVDRFVVGVPSAVASPADDSQSAAIALPLPIAYELAAIDRLGEAILLGSGVDPAGLEVGRYPEAIYGALNDDPVNTAAGPLLPGDTSLADPVALGTDDWSLVWGSRLSAPIVDRLVDAVRADSYRPVDRAGTRCFVAVFQTATETDGSYVLSALGQWASAAPAGSSAAATPLSPTRIQLEACDPGPDAVATPNPASADALIARQIARLTP